LGEVPKWRLLGFPRIAIRRATLLYEGLRARRRVKYRELRQHEKVPGPSLVLIGAYDSRRAWRGSATRIRLYFDGYVTRYAQSCISIQYHNVWGRTRGVQVRRNHPRALGGWCLCAILDANFAEFTFYALG
jgi:hypothetical protein